MTQLSSCEKFGALNCFVDLLLKKKSRENLLKLSNLMNDETKINITDGSDEFICSSDQLCYILENFEKGELIAKRLIGFSGINLRANVVMTKNKKREEHNIIMSYKGDFISSIQHIITY